MSAPAASREQKPELGRLQRVSVRGYWLNEAQDFTPWLAQEQNIALLGESIGLDLEVEAQEQRVGPFQADILCKETASGHYVLIENQLERTDHVHMGQLLTYAAGLDAATVVWVAAQFTDEHRAALDWLNRITSAEFNFFGLEIELWRIGDSPLGPKFNVVSRPNDWSKTVRETADTARGPLNETQKLHLEFWTQFRQFMHDRNSPVRMNRPAPDYWTQVAVGRSYFGLVVLNNARDKWSGVYLSIWGPNARAHFHLLRDKFRSEIEQAVPNVDWQEQATPRESRISLKRTSDIADKTTWPELNTWLAATVGNAHALFRPIVKTLDASGVHPIGGPGRRPGRPTTYADARRRRVARSATLSSQRRRSTASEAGLTASGAYPRFRCRA